MSRFFLLFGLVVCPGLLHAAEKIQPHEAAKLLREDKAILVDVREEREVREGMANKALWMPWSRIQKEGKAWQNFLVGLPKDRDIIVYCAVGGRAERAAGFFEKQGYAVKNLGAFSDWKKAGYATRKGP